MSHGTAKNLAELTLTRNLRRKFQGPLWAATICGALISLVAGSLNAQPTVSTSADEKSVPGSRLLQPGSFGFEIPVAEVRPNDQNNVTTTDESGNQVVARSYVKVGNNYVVMLPDGRLVGRMASQIGTTEKQFKPTSQRDLARKILDNELTRFANVKAERSKHYVFLYNTSDEFQQATQRILESMFNGVKDYAEDMGIETHNPRVPLVVIMFKTQEEFQAYREMHRGIVAYYDMVSNYIVLCEESPLADSRPDLALGQLLSTIAHEGAHQILHNIGVQKRLSMWPMWLSEGIAEFFAPTSFGKRNRWKGAGDVNDLRMFELESFMQTRYLEGFDGRTITEVVAAPRLDSTGYATAWSTVHYLAKKKRRQFNQYVAMMSKLSPMRGMVAPPDEPVADNLQHFHDYFGDDMEKTEQNIVDYLGELNYESPVAGFIHYVGLAEVPVNNGTKRYACFFHTQDKVEAWKQVLESKLSDEQKANSQWEVKRVQNRNAANGLIRRFLR